MIYVVGSGPAGTAAAHALLVRGHRVTMLDVGHDLEEERRALVERMARQRPEEWSEEDLRALKGPTRVKMGGVERKLAYGSDYPYRRPDGSPPSGEGRRSFALGGLSTVWGAAVLPYRPAEIRDWPIDAALLEPHYDAVLSFIDHAFARDDLEELFPLHGGPPRPLALGRQAEAFLDAAARHRAALRAAGLLVGRARLAVRSAPVGGCVYCGLCMYGCPYGHIYSTRDDIVALRDRPEFSYRPGVLVERVLEDGPGVRIEVRRLADGQREEIRGEAVLLACGPVSTAEIVLRSRGARGRDIVIEGRDYFIVPFLRRPGTPDVRGERLHTLAQVFLEIYDPRTSEVTAHLQIYTYNDLYDRLLRALLGPFVGLLRRPLDAILGRLFVIQGVVRTPRPSEVIVRLDEDGALRCRRRPSADVPAASAGILRLLRRHRRALGGAPVGLLLRHGPPGEGYYGGSFPMRRRPGAWETDSLGRLGGKGRIHIVDSSIFPSIPPTPITLPLMANAHRIASAL